MFSASSILVTIGFFLVRESSSFQLGKAPCHNLNIVEPEAPKSLVEEPRRVFFADILKGAAAAGLVSLPTSAIAQGDIVSAGAIKVTAIAHTFVTTGKSPSPKPIRENDATRFFANAKVVYIFEGKNSDSTKLAQEVTDLTKKRKADEGPGVTPGNISTLVPDGSKGGVIDRVVEAAKKLPDGDVLLVGPIPSQGTEGDGKLLASTASGLGTFVGGQRGGGVISVLLNGPKENFKLIESGYPASELLWYSLPPKP